MGERNNSVDLARLVCALAVVALHTGLSLVVLPGVLGRLANLAVPFFLVVSGYYFSQKLLSFPAKAPKSYIRRILFLYLFWSGVYLIADIVTVLTHGGALWPLLRRLPLSLLLLGVTGELWFFPALIWVVLIATVSMRFHKLNMVGALSLFLFVAMRAVPYTGPESDITWGLSRILATALPYWFLGYFIFRLSLRGAGFPSRTTLVGITLMCVLGAGVSVLLGSIWRPASQILLPAFTYLGLGALISTFLQTPLPSFRAAGAYASATALITYVLHPLIIRIVNAVSMGLSGAFLSPVPLFLLTTAVCLLAGYTVLKCNNSFLSRIAR